MRGYPAGECSGNTVIFHHPIDRITGGKDEYLDH
jgi:hypothetical protein